MILLVASHPVELSTADLIVGMLAVGAFSALWIILLLWPGYYELRRLGHWSFVPGLFQQRVAEWARKAYGEEWAACSASRREEIEEAFVKRR